MLELKILFSLCRPSLAAASLESSMFSFLQFFAITKWNELGIRKLIFGKLKFLSRGNFNDHEQPSEAWSSLATQVGAEKNSAMVYEGNKHSVKMNNMVETKGKVLIEKIK